MSDLTKEFITLTQYNCVKECNALLQRPKMGNYKTIAALFGLYCGILIYRSYAKYLTEQEAKRTR